MGVPDFLGVSNWFPLRAMGFLNSLGVLNLLPCWPQNVGVLNLLPNIFAAGGQRARLETRVLKCGCPELFVWLSQIL
jgi:hypothetical protein